MAGASAAGLDGSAGEFGGPVFALELQHAGVAGADRLVPVTLLVVLGTVLVASLTVVPVAGLLGLRQTSQVADSER